MRMGIHTIHKHEHKTHLLEVVRHRRQLGLQREDHAGSVRLLVASLKTPAALRFGNLLGKDKIQLHFKDEIPSPPFLLQLSDLAVEGVHVLLYDERQLLNLSRPIIEQRLAACEQRQLFQLCIGVAEITSRSS